MARNLSLALAALFAVFGLSCSQIHQRVSILWTDVPEITGYVERFNASQRDWQIVVEYHGQLSDELQTPGVKADLVVSRDLFGKKLKSSLSNLSFLFDRGGLTKSLFYDDLIVAGSDGDTPLLLPLSFNLPILTFREHRLPGLEGFALSLDRIRVLGREFNEKSTKDFRRLAFSPRWNGFAVRVLDAMGAYFQEDFRSSVVWDETKLGAAIASLQAWIANDSGGLETEKEFTRKYLQTNSIRLLDDGRVLFAATTLKDFLALPEQEREGLDFRYPTYQNKIPVENNVVWACIPSSAATRQAAESFLIWYFQESTQKDLLQYTRDAYTHSFGLCGGLSPLHNVNQKYFPSLYPELDARIPSTSEVSFAPSQPANWSNIKEHVLSPWLESRLLGKETATFEARLAQYYNQSSQH